MFGDAAVRLLKLMGHSGTVPGALLAADVQTALAVDVKAIAESMSLWRRLRMVSIGQEARWYH